MAYARFSGTCDVYVFAHVNLHLQCCGCLLGEEWDFDSTQAMVEHLAQHRAAGHQVPAGLEDALVADDKDNFPPSCREGHLPGEPYHPYPHSELAASLVRVDCTRCGTTLP